MTTPLPTQIVPFTLDLPWETTIDGGPVTQVRIDLQQTDYRTFGLFGATTEIAEYQNNGPEASPAWTFNFALSINLYSFEFETAFFKTFMTTKFIYAVSRYAVNKEVILATPADKVPPLGIGWPLSQEVVDYMDSGGSILPAPRGGYTAFRLYPFSEYGSADEILPTYRGNPPGPS